MQEQNSYNICMHSQIFVEFTISFCLACIFLRPNSQLVTTHKDTLEVHEAVITCAMAIRLLVFAKPSEAHINAFTGDSAKDVSLRTVFINDLVMHAKKMHDNALFGSLLNDAVFTDTLFDTEFNPNVVDVNGSRLTVPSREQIVAFGSKLVREPKLKHQLFGIISTGFILSGFASWQHHKKGGEIAPIVASSAIQTNKQWTYQINSDIRSKLANPSRYIILFRVFSKVLQFHIYLFHILNIGQHFGQVF